MCTSTLDMKHSWVRRTNINVGRAGGRGVLNHAILVLEPVSRVAKILAPYQNSTFNFIDRTPWAWGRGAAGTVIVTPPSTQKKWHATNVVSLTQNDYQQIKSSKSRNCGTRQDHQRVLILLQRLRSAAEHTLATYPEGKGVVQSSIFISHDL